MKIDFRETAVLALMMIGASALMAHDKPAASNSKPAAQASMSTATPAAETTKLIKMMSGNWTVTEKSNPNPMMPKGGTGKGIATMTAGPGGLSLMEKYHSSGLMGTNFIGYGTFWWDDKAQVFRGLWCDTVTPGGCDASGTTKWDGANLVRAGGQTGTIRARVVLISSKSSCRREAALLWCSCSRAQTLRE